MKRRYLRMAGVAILVIGLSAAAWAWLSDSGRRADVVGYEIVNGQSYEITAGESKLYRRDLERIGGKAAIFADDLARWFESLLHGRRLAILLAAVAVGSAGWCFRAAARQPGKPDDETSSDAS